VGDCERSGEMKLWVGIRTALAAYALLNYFCFGGGHSSSIQLAHVIRYLYWI